MSLWHKTGGGAAAGWNSNHFPILLYQQVLLFALAKVTQPTIVYKCSISVTGRTRGFSHYVTRMIYLGIAGVVGVYVLPSLPAILLKINFLAGFCQFGVLLCQWYSIMSSRVMVEQDGMVRVGGDTYIPHHRTIHQFPHQLDLIVETVVKWWWG